MIKGPLIPAFSLAGGIAVSAIYDISWVLGIIPVALGLLLYFHILRSSKDPVSSFRMSKWHTVWIVLLFLGIGMIDESLSRPTTIENGHSTSGKDKIICEVTNVLSKTYGDRIDLKINGTNGARARIRSGVTELSPGDIVAVPALSLKDVSSDTTVIGQKIAPMLKASGILYTGRIDYNKIEKVGKNSTFKYHFARLRDRIEIEIERSHIKSETSNFLNAILMGDKTGLDEETRLTFTHGGIAHMLALSGLHLGILAMLLLMALWPIKLIGKYKWVYAIAILLLWMYVLTTGLSNSSIRACIMTTLAFIGVIAERKNNASNALCSACILILLFDPSALFDAGFQLSAVCVGSLIAFASALNPISHRQHPVLYYICGLLIASMVASGASWVLTSYYFSQIPLMFLPGNILLLPILPIYLGVAVVYVIFLCVGLEIRWIGSVLDQGYDMMIWITKTISGGPEFVVEYQLPLWAVIGWLTMILFAAWWINRRKDNESNNRIS